MATRLLQRVGRERDHLVVGHLLERAVASDLRPVLPRALELGEAVAAHIAEPAVVDREIFPRLKASDPVAARAELDVEAHAATSPDALRPVQVRGPADEAALAVGGRGDGAVDAHLL